MSRRRSREELEAAAEAQDARQAEINQKRRECGHYDCAPTEWHWSGQIRVMRCNECGEEDYREEETVVSTTQGALFDETDCETATPRSP